jgi:hypothetical protein
MSQVSVYYHAELGFGVVRAMIRSNIEDGWGDDRVRWRRQSQGGVPRGREKGHVMSRGSSRVLILFPNSNAKILLPLISTQIYQTSIYKGKFSCRSQILILSMIVLHQT